MRLTGVRIISESTPPNFFLGERPVFFYVFFYDHVEVCTAVIRYGSFSGAYL